MKKKIFDKVLTVASVVIAFIFIIVLLVTVFGGFEADTFNNSLVQGLFMALGVLYIVMAIAAIVFTFTDSDVIKEIVLNSESGNNARASAGVIKKLVKKNIKTVKGVFCQRISLIMTEYGVKLKIAIKIQGKNIEKTVVYLKCLLEDAFLKTLGYRFYAIDFKVSSLKTDYIPNTAEIESKASEQYESLKEEEEKVQEEVNTTEMGEETNSDEE